MRRASLDVRIDEIDAVEKFLFDGVYLHAVPITPCDIAYIIETPDIPGVFNVTRAQELGIPKGPLYGRLKQGHSIIMDDCREIFPHEVLGPSDVGSVAILVCSFGSSPGDDGLTSLSKNTSLAKYFQGEPESHRLKVVYHFGSAEVVNNPIYSLWKAQFPEGVRHVGLGKGTSVASTAFIASTRYANKLNKLCPEVFPQLSVSSSVDTVAYPGLISGAPGIIILIYSIL
jgi:ribonuclease Z